MSKIPNGSQAYAMQYKRIELNKSGFTAAYFRQPLGRPNSASQYKRAL